MERLTGAAAMPLGCLPPAQANMPREQQPAQLMAHRATSSVRALGKPRNLDSSTACRPERAAEDACTMHFISLPQLLPGLA